MKRRKDRWIGVSPERRRVFIKARHKLSFANWCMVVQARINLVRARRDKKSAKKSSVPKGLDNLPIMPNQAVRSIGVWTRLVNWFRELFTPAKKLPVG